MIELDREGNATKPKKETVMAALDEARVFAVEATDDGRFLFVERCDDYFSAILTKEQVLLLVDELRALANNT